MSLGRWMTVFATLGVASATTAGAGLPEPSVVTDVDLQRYAGTWYEIARLPNRYQRDCTGDVTAQYEPLPDGRLRVINQCKSGDGSEMRVEGVARLADENQPAKLEVRFAPSLFSFLPFVWGDYWILDVAPDYSHALVGSPDREYLWILSRTPQLDREVYQRLVDAAAAQRYAVANLQPTPQSARGSNQSSLNLNQLTTLHTQTAGAPWGRLLTP